MITYTNKKHLNVLCSYCYAEETVEHVILYCIAVLLIAWLASLMRLAKLYIVARMAVNNAMI